MKTKKYLHRIGAVLIAFALAGCAVYPISKKYREEAAKDVTVPMVQKDLKQYKGKVVIWGGRILDLTNDSAGSRLIILDSKLDDEEYPLPARFSRGRFIATTSKFLDSAIFLKGHRVTLAGEIVGVRTEQLGNGTYAYPEVKIEEMRYWEPSPNYINPYYSPRWGYGLPYYDFYDDFFFYEPHHQYEWRDDGLRYEHREGRHHRR